MIPQNPYALNLNIPNLSIDECVEELARREHRGENTGSLRCWLTYRCVEGKLALSDWALFVRPVELIESDKHMEARWATSQATAETYLFAKSKDYLAVLISANSCIIGWMTKNHIWLPQVLNVLRCSCITSYHAFLKGDHKKAVEIADTAIDLWKQSTTGLNWREWTLRFTEMRDDIVALQILVFIAGRCGVEVTEMKWMNAAICMPKERWSPFYECLIEMGELNESARIWKPKITPKQIANMSLDSITNDPTFVVVCKSGGDYSMEHVECIRRQFYAHSRNGNFTFRCITDTPSESWHVPMQTGLNGWWSTMEAYRFTGPTVFTGLDTLICNDLSPFFDLALRCGPSEIYGIHDFYHPKWSDGVSIWNGDHRAIGDNFDPLSKSTPTHGVMDAASSRMDELGITKRYMDDEISGIISYKKHIRDSVTPSDGAGINIVCWHGKPRPWESESWAGEEYRSYMK